MLFLCYNTYMKKIYCLFLSTLLVLSGCSSKKQALSLYEAYYQIISENTEYVEESSNYSLSYEVEKSDDGNYYYYIFLDSPTISMYDVVMMAIENDVSYSSNLKMVPSIGIFDGNYNLVPNQINKDKGYVKGLVISGESEEDTIHIKLMVEWKNKNRDKTSREFHNVELTENGYSYVTTQVESKS